MGDRSFCTLKIFGALHISHIDFLAEAIDDAGANPMSDGNIRQSLREGHNVFEFEEVNYAQLDNDLHAAMKALNLSYAWVNDSGDEYDAGVEYFDATSGEEAEYSLSGGDICLTLREIEAEGALDTARRWDRFESQGSLIVYSSQHDLLGRQARGDISQAQVALALAARKT